MGFDAHERPISESINSESRFLIPRYQRSYAWTSKNWTELLEDILFLIDNNLIENHFLGCFVFEQNESKKTNTVIDGQQRSITVFIMLSCIACIFNELNSKKLHEGIVEYMIVKDRDGNKHTRISGSELNPLGSIINAVIEFKEKYNSEKPLGQINFNIHAGYNKSIKQCFDFFLKNFKDYIMDDESIQAQIAKAKILRDKILGLTIVEIIANSEQEGYNIFEVLNARGMALNNHELLKNYVFRYIQPRNQIDDAKETWKCIVDLLTYNNSLHFDEFLQCFCIHKYSKPDKENTSYRLIKENVNKHQVNALLLELYNKAEIYRIFQMVSECQIKEIKEVLEFFRVRKHRQFKPIFLALYSKHNEDKLTERDFIKTMQFLKNFYLASSAICKNTANKSEQTVYTYSKKINNDFSLDIIEEMKSKFTKQLNNRDTFISLFCELGWSNKNKSYASSSYKRDIQYILSEVEHFFNTGELEINNMTIEHIMPDSINDISCKIGNLLPLGKRLNERADNKAFTKKIIIYKESNFETVKTFLERHSTKSTWLKKDIDERGKRLASLFYDKILCK